MPMALLSFQDELPAPVSQSLKEVGAAFTRELLAEVGNQGASSDNTIPLSAWQRARSVVDYQFLKLFGSESFNKAGMAAAMDAMAQP